ncbi:lipid A export permease/ATP-binding protein MsbA [Legionella longbeachae]|uniref:Lipid A export ATP-binding/permease protein MsbA n=1 Tax=Legionella longbeachae serogroup 1 (strain NSW150) TaxID=661367 RepID=D3HRA9_LEGLN|nr:lipid A export permease/ATP-binding protein MsbA [Legionella longbeachae]VEE01945.1 Lipid A export ATP-binding/permease MsbA [Legionella oakridgensis]HBD7396803.1 lipid A export permease/ATP-binding protein MsbA [Legionella pneumophila]ARB91740.1 lipid A export permease/ATP-binding protein MsbA [Legionella longbeachae]ARM35115.1 lipid A export permease/ATP-binding protein MsbA [Legionella longbeachae]EEZ95451.1 lipid A export permease/ATP-binding protein MsbA [Legionella longbeachae D-4968]
MKKKPTVKTSILYKRLLTYVKPFWPILALGVFANMLYSLIDAGFTYMMRPFFDKSFINVDMDFIKKIPYIVLIGITLRGLVSSLGSYCMTWVARSVVKVLREKVFNHILRLPADFYDQATSGQMLSKILYDVEQVAQVSADALTDIVQNICLIVGFLTVMFVICWQLSLMFLLTIPFVGFIVNFTNKRVRRISHKVQKTMGEVTEIASEAIEGYKVVRIFDGIAYESEKFSRAIEHSRQNDMKVAASKALNVSGVQIVIAIGIAAIIAAAIQLSTVVIVSAGSFLAIIAAMIQLIKPMKTLTTLNAVIQKGLAGAESVFNMLDVSIEQEQGVILPRRARGELVFQHVSYAYRQGENVLHDVSFTVEAGKTVALVGHSGSGKTTIASLIPRFYEITEGIIALDNIPINQIGLSSLREQMALVSQNVTLFNDTLANNIAYGRSDISREQIMHAAKLAFADEFINRLPEGYETRVGENGVLLSGGQRQRIAIARAILKDAPILILDEATSALDSESERYIQIALEGVMKNRTTIVIAHRLSTIKHADKIIVMQHGRIVEQGTHEELLDRQGHYAQLQGMQHSGIIQEEVIA